MQRSHAMPFGATMREADTFFRLWASGNDAMGFCVEGDRHTVRWRLGDTGTLKLVANLGDPRAPAAAASSGAGWVALWRIAPDDGRSLAPWSVVWSLDPDRGP